MRRDARENKAEILKCAKTLFVQEGVAKVSMNQIAKTLGIGAGTLYRHYANKATLCMALVYSDLEAFVNGGQVYLETANVSPDRKFHELLTRYLKFRAQNAALLANIDAGNETTDIGPFYAKPVYDALAALFQKVLKANMAIPDETVSRFQADMLIAMLKSDAYAYQRQVRGLTQEQLISKIESLFLDDKK